MFSFIEHQRFQFHSNMLYVIIFVHLFVTIFLVTCHLKNSLQNKKRLDLSGTPNLLISITLPIKVIYLLDSFPWIVYWTIASHFCRIHIYIVGRLHKVIKTRASSLLDSTINLAPVIMCRWLPPTTNFVKQTWI
jgi:hypothetical protein